jgi:hypothetical protein
MHMGVKTLSRLHQVKYSVSGSLSHSDDDPDATKQLACAPL